MKSKVGKILCFTLAFLLVAQPTLLSANDFGGPSSPAAAPGNANSGGQGGGGQAGPNGTGNSAGGNIYLWDGSEFFGITDLVLRGVFPIRITRHYNSRSTYDSPLGYGWDISYNERLYTYADGSAVIRWATGFKKRFVFSGGGYVSDDHFPGTLVQHGDGTFTFTSLKGMQRHFDLNGRLARIEDYHGNSLRMSYTVSKQPLTGLSPFSIDSATPQIVSYDYQLSRVEEWDVSDTFTGRYVNFGYNGDGRLTSVTDFSGRTILYHHDRIGNLARVDYPEGLYKTYTYEDSNDKHNITAFARGYGADDSVIQITNAYDDQDRVITQAHTNGTLVIEYIVPLVRTKVTKTVKDGNGATLHQFDTIYEFDDQGNLLKAIDADGNVGELVRDAKGNCIREVTWKNVGSPSSPVLVEERVINHTYDSDRNLVSTTLILDTGETITRGYTYDHGWLQSWTVTSSYEPGKVYRGEHQFEYHGSYPKHVSQRRFLLSNDGTPEYQTLEFDYNPQGQLITLTYGNGDQESFGYANGYMTNANGVILGRDTKGLVTSITDLNGNQTSYVYDLLDRLTTMQNALNEETILTYTGYDLTGMEHGRFEGAPGQKWYLEYDGLGRLTSLATDKAGTPIMQNSYTYDSEGNILTQSNALGETVSYAYDYKNRMVSVVDATGMSIARQYDVLGRVTQITDANGKSIRRFYDDLDRLTKGEDARGYATTYTYNALGLLTALTDPRGKTTSFGYDLAGRRIWKESPLGQTKIYHYDPRARIDQIINADGGRIDFEYNSRNYLEAVSLQEGTTKTLTFTHDPGGNLLTFTDSAFSTSPMYTYTYDNLNRIDTIVYHAINKTLDYNYNHVGSRKKLTCKSGSTELFSYTYGYDGASRLASITESPDDKTTAFTYDAAGRLNGRVYPNGSSAAMTYRPNGLMDELRYQKTDSSTLEFFQHAYDNMGYVTGITTSTGSTTFSYDDSYQLESATFPAVTGLSEETYSYDGMGNRLTSNEASDWTYDDNGRLAGFGGHSFTYDGRGNQLTETVGGLTTSYSYDDLDRLVGVTTTGVTAVYTYDHLGRRVSKEVNGNAAWFMYDGNKLLAEFDSAGSLSRRYCYASGRNDLVSVSDATGHYSALTDRLGSPVLILDATQTSVWKANYQTFGEPIINEDPDADGVGFKCNLRLPGQYFDEESNLHYNIARYYNPRTGRYLQEDPITGSFANALNLNRYVYGHANPLSEIDPDGREPITIAITLAFVAFAAMSAYGGYKAVEQAKERWEGNWPPSPDEFLSVAGEIVMTFITAGFIEPIGWLMRNLQEVSDWVDSKIEGVSNAIPDMPGWEIFGDEWGGKFQEWSQTSWSDHWDDFVKNDVSRFTEIANEFQQALISEGISQSISLYGQYGPTIERHVRTAQTVVGLTRFGANVAWGWLKERLSGLSWGSVSGSIAGK